MPAEPAAPEAEDSNPRTRLELVNPKRIGTNPAQPRRVFSAADLATLKTSVERDGLLQPILVRRVDGDLQLIAGERRLRAAKELGLEEIPARVVDVPDDRMLEIALIENVHRADLNPIELAEAYRALLVERDWTQDQLSGELGVSRSAISNSLRLLDLPGDMQRALVRGQISSGHAKVLLSVDNDDTRHELFERIAEDNLSVRDLEAAKGAVAAIEPVDEVAAKPDLRRPEKKPKKPYILSLESELSEHLGSKVRIRERRGGKGVVSIDFYSKDGFERLRQLLTRDL
ncbi:MAG: ParB/RepB/Spo0J family partition protein [Planctomycetota bacterium]